MGKEGTGRYVSRVLPLYLSLSLSLELVRTRLLSLASPFGLSLSLPLSLFPLRQLATALSRSYLLPLTLSLSLPLVSVWRAVPSHVGWMACSPLHRLLVGRAILSCVSLVCSPSRPSIPRLSCIARPWFHSHSRFVSPHTNRSNSIIRFGRSGLPMGVEWIPIGVEWIRHRFCKGFQLFSHGF